MTSRAGYGGTRRKIVLAFDVGTTYSGISYSILDPGQVPEIKGVTKFPAQETFSGASKIPTILYYDRKGNVKAVGAEAAGDAILETAEEEGWAKAEWFKLHLRSKFGGGKKMNDNVKPLPPGKTVVEVFADFLRYLLKCAKSYIQETHPSGVELWNLHRDEIHFVLSHPNGWEGTEQSQMRRAAVLAALVPDSQSGHSRISFVTEGEASLHFAIENGVLSQTMEGEGIVIVDAGGGTIDVSTYKRRSQDSGKIFEEIAIPQCYFHGSVFVTFKAKDFLKNLLSDSPFLEDLDYISECFDKTTKPRFRNAEDPQLIRFGSTRDNDPHCGIRFGSLKLAGTDVAKFFEPSVSSIIQAVMEQRKTAKNNISHVILVGGFAASDWLFEKLRTTLIQRGLTVLRPESHSSNKAVSDGALSFYLNHYVRSRIAKVTYGNIIKIPYDSTDPEHKKRAATTIVDLDGTRLIPSVFSPSLFKNTQVSEATEFTQQIYRLLEDPSSLSSFKSTIWCYRGEDQDPEWYDEDSGNYSVACRLTADLSNIPKTATLGSNGRRYYEVDYTVVLLFGLTELKAQLRWIENGIQRQSQASVIYEEE